MSVATITTHLDGSLTVTMLGGNTYWVSRHGWIFERDRKTPVEHPHVDEIMRAITTFEFDQ